MRGSHPPHSSSFAATMGYFEGLLCSPRETLAYARIYANPIFFKTSHESSDAGISSSSLEPIDQMNIERLKAQIPAVRVSFHHIVTSNLRMRMIHNDSKKS